MVPFYGGKGNIAEWIYGNFDLTGINTYVEPFSGMFKVYLCKKNDFSGVKNIIYNDKYAQNGNIFLCAKKPYFFLKAINEAFLDKEAIFYYRRYILYEDAYVKFKEIYLDYKKGRRKLPEVDLLEPNYEAAVIYSFLRYSSQKQFHFTDASFKNSTYPASWYKRYKLMQTLWNNLNDKKLIEKVARINEITALDFEDVIRKNNTPDTFIYCDPPYFSREHYYDSEKKGVFTKESHEKLARAINESTAKIALSYYDFDELHDYYPKDKYTWLEKEVWNSAGKKKSTELLILKYPVKVDEK